MNKLAYNLACTAIALVPAFSHGENSSQALNTVENPKNAHLIQSEYVLSTDFGPQSPRDLSVKTGANRQRIPYAPKYNEMNVCNIHFHKNAEHKGGEFTTFAGAGDGLGFNTGYLYNRKLRLTESTMLPVTMCNGEHGGLNVGDTIEVHYVHSTANVKPGETLASCLSENSKNPALRVESQVMVLVNDAKAASFVELTALGERNGYQQALHIPNNTGRPIEYSGSTTGPIFNEKDSPFHVTWSVRPRVVKVDAKTVGDWCSGNPFKESHAHGVRNLVTQPDKLSMLQ